MDRINKLRKKIDKLDRELLTILDKRMAVSVEVGKYKAKNKVAIRDRKRESNIIRAKMDSSDLNKSFVKKLFKLVFKESRRLQRGLK